MIRVLHAADLHLDSPFQALGREKALLRRGEQRALMRRIAEIARARQADIAVFSGDLFDSENVFSDTGRILEEVLSGMEIPVFIAPGNHDWYGPRSAWVNLRLGENVHVFTSPEMTCVELPALGARVWGSAFTARYRTPPLMDFEAEKDGDVIDIMVLHGEVGNPASVYGAITEEQLARSGMDYVALGHVHSFSGLRRAGETYYAWPGCPEGRGFDETGEKGVILAELAPGSCRAEFIPVAGRRYEIARVDVTDADDIPAAVTAALPADTARDVYRIVLAGQTDETPDLAALTGALEGRFFALELRDETAPRRDIWAERGSDTLKGIFLDNLWKRLEATPGAAGRERITEAARLGLLAMENGEEPPLF